MSTPTINCPNCGQPIEIEEVLKKKLEKELLHEEKVKHEKELADLKEKTISEAKEKAKAEFELKLKNSKEENEEIKNQNEKLQKEFLSLSKQLRESIREQDEYKLKLEKTHLEQLEQERKQAREIASKQTSEEYQQKIEEMRKQLTDAIKAKDELSRKLEQGSQQTQGEVVELKLEETLRTAFPGDMVEAVGKGVNGADITQIVKSPNGTICGKIIWESKQTKKFEPKWIPKLKEDMRKDKADLSVIVTTKYLEATWNGLSQHEGLWICNFNMVLPLASLLRKALLDVGYQKAVNLHQGKKADLVYDYVTGTEFRQQVEALVEVFTEMQLQLAKERNAFEKIWKQREGQLQRMLSSTAGIYGSLQGRAGNAIPEIKGLNLLELPTG